MINYKMIRLMLNPIQYGILNSVSSGPQAECGVFMFVKGGMGCEHCKKVEINEPDFENINRAGHWSDFGVCTS